MLNKDFNVNTVIDVWIHSVNFTFDQQLVQSVVETEIIYVTLLAIHRKLPAFKTVQVRTFSWNWIQNSIQIPFFRTHLFDPGGDGMGKSQLPGVRLRNSQFLSDLHVWETGTFSLEEHIPGNRFPETRNNVSLW